MDIIIILAKSAKIDQRGSSNRGWHPRGPAHAGPRTRGRPRAEHFEISACAGPRAARVPARARGPAHSPRAPAFSGFLEKWTYTRYFRNLN